MKTNNTIKIGLIAAFSVIAVLGIGVTVQDSMSYTVAPIKDSRPSPPPLTLDFYGEKTVSMDNAKASSSLSWVNEPKLPEGFTQKEIRVDEDSNVIAIVYGNDELGNVRETVTDNSLNGLVVVYSKNISEDRDWETYVSERVKQLPHIYSSHVIDGKIILLADANDAYNKPAKAYYQDAPNAVVAMSGVISPEDLTKLVSTITLK